MPYPQEWKQQQTFSPDERLRDGIDHEASQECVCGPTPRREVCHHGAEQVYHQHHPLTQKTRRKANA